MSHCTINLILRELMCLDKVRLHLPAGHEVKDLQDRPWILGEFIDAGNCGEIYSVWLGYSKGLVEPYNTIRAKTNVEYAIKFPLKSNRSFNHECGMYTFLAPTDRIEEWMTKRKLKFLGVPRYVALGKNNKFGIEFIVLERLGKDLHRLWEENGKRFSAKTVVNIAIQILDVLEYLHEDGLHVHNDIKPLNILVDPKCCDQVYLIDFGIAFWYIEGSDRAHKSNKPNPK
uniref:Protein kinase domain-containing protein n=1 Tax=Strigamia maritima TaxID=126957 RepID=T1JHI1_STRMM